MPMHPPTSYLPTTAARSPSSRPPPLPPLSPYPSSPVCPPPTWAASPSQPRTRPVLSIRRRLPPWTATTSRFILCTPFIPTASPLCPPPSTRQVLSPVSTRSISPRPTTT